MRRPPRSLSSLGNMHNADGGPVDDLVARLRRPVDRRYLQRVGALGRIEALGREVARTAPPPSGPRVLVTSLRYWCEHTAYEAVIALALRMRGADVAHVICGGGQPACEVGRARVAEPRPCDRCGWYTASLAAATGLPAHRLGDALPWGASAGRAPADVSGLPLGARQAERMADISVPWLLRVADYRVVPGANAVVRDFSIAAAGVAAATERLLDETRPDVLFSLNGLFAAERTMREVAAARGVRGPTYEIAPRADALVVSQDIPAPEMDTGEAWARYRDVPLSPAQSDALDELVLGRVSGTTAHESYFSDPQSDLDALRSELAIPANARVVSLFTNLAWDSACLHHDVAYPSMLDWMAGAARAVAELDNVVLVMRVHPAELRWGSRERAEDGLRARVGDLPVNVRIVGPDRAISSYALVDMSDLVLAYTSTVGLEAALRGKRVAVAGAVHYRGRGFTRDLDRHDDLARALRDERGALPAETVEIARRYAFVFFFRTMVPLSAVRTAEGRVLELPTSAADLRGGDPRLDWIADRILDGDPFTLPDELTL